jgi:N-methylhydantoinase A
MQSNGGLMAAEAAAAKPMHIVESGPAAGVVGAQALARAKGLPDVITFDMGGTTAKAATVERGEVTRAGEYSVGAGIMIGSRLLTGAGYLLKVPAIDLAEVGAGGGSLVRIDAGGSLQVGPESAGAAPGPVCYDLGGTQPTVTDANVILGYLNPGYLVGGAVRLNAAKARAAFEAQVATPLGLDLARAAHGAHLIAVSNMIRAIRAVSTERGRDPRDFALFAFGGNGPLFACRMAEALSMTRVVVPPSPGLFSAFGLLYADVEHHYSRSFRRLSRRADLAALNAAWDALSHQALEQLAAEGFTGPQATLRRTAALHYHGQSFDLTVAVPDGPITAETLHAMEEAFGQEHEHTYGHRASVEEPVELVSIQVVGQGLRASSSVGPAAGGGTPSRAEPALPPPRPAYLGPEQGWTEVPVIHRSGLTAPRVGPLIVEEYDATCLVLPGWRASIDTARNLLLERE